jgi:asparagine synthase (glutamine-hydrolysing)
MCGIAGHIGIRIFSPARLDKCLHQMAHRGPDGQYWVSTSFPDGKEGYYFLHSRLAILDLDPRAAQPFRVGPLLAVYNGEIYNYLELRVQLKRFGYTFHTESDTEVLLQAILHWGWDGALARCNGQWAFAIYDARDKIFRLSRDRFGEKPLLIYEDEEGLFFGSELPFLQILRGKPFSINKDHIRRFLVNGYKSLYKTQETFFEDVWELPPGSLLQIRREEPKLQRLTYYWHLPSVLGQEDESMSSEEAGYIVRGRLDRAVEQQLRADVPIAFSLSGGVDSTSLAALAKKQGYDVRGFHVTSKDFRYDEESLVKELTSALDIPCTYINPCEHGVPFFETLRQMIKRRGSPLLTLTYYAHALLVSMISAHGYKVVIGGAGADEVFSGYYDHHIYSLTAQSMAKTKEGQAAFHRARDLWQRHTLPFVRNPSLQNLDARIKNPQSREHIYEHAQEFSSYLQEPWGEPFGERQFGVGLLRNRMLNELFYESIPVILHEEDLNAMSVSIENRSPYLDRDLVELSWRIPSDLLIQDGLAKFPLRMAMKDLVPSSILQNPRKIGFNLPLEEAFPYQSDTIREQFLDEGPIFSIVKKSAIEQLFKAAVPLPNHISKFLFSCFSARIFMEEFGYGR